MIRALALLLISLLVVACPEDKERDRVPPRVIAVEPATPVVPVTTTFQVLFSESLNAKTVDGDPTAEHFSVALLLTADAKEDFLSDIDNPPLSTSRLDNIVAGGVTLGEDDTVITFDPSADLLPGTAYSLVVSSEVRDAAGNPIVDGAGRKAQFRWDFTTDAGPPAVASTTLVSAGSPLVVPNRRRIDVTFNQPVQNVSAQTLFIQGSPAPAVDAVTLDETRTVATLFLAAQGDGCQRLGASSSYALVATADIVGDNEQVLLPYNEPFTTGPSCDVTANVISAAPEAIAGEVDATLNFDTTKASTTEVRFGETGGELDCLGLSCPVLGAAARNPVAGASPVRFAHSLHIEGLTLGVGYDFVVFAEDDVGNVATRSGSFVTAPLPKIAINEIEANPPGDASEPRDEFIELANYGDTELALDGYTLEVDGGEEAGGNSCSLGNPGPVVPAHGYRVLAGKDLALATYPGLEEAAVVRSTASSFCGAVTNTDGQSFVLKDASGRPVSRFSAYGDLLPFDVAGVSCERTAPDAADVSASYCNSREDTGPTPAAENSVFTRGCD